MSAFLVVPCFNEAGRWNAEYWANIVSTTDAQFLFVDDGSTDGTGQILADFAAKSDASFLDRTTNAGKAEAVRQGWLEVARSQEPDAISALGFLDADGAFASSDVVDLVGLALESNRTGGSDAWWSSRVALAGRNIQRNMRRHYLGRVIATYLSLGEQSIPYDTQSGLKLFDASQYFLRLIEEPFVTRWLFEMEILARFRELAGRPMRVWEMPLNYWVDVEGSKVTARESIRIAAELSRLKGVQRRSRTNSAMKR